MKQKKITNTKRDSAPYKRLFIGLAFMVVAAIAMVLIMVLPSKGNQAADDTPEIEFSKEGVASFYDDNGNELCAFDIEIADNQDDMKTGLMYRDSLGTNQAMLFLYDKPDVLTFWMKNTYLPLDIIFISPDSSIVSIGENTTPFSEQSIVSKGPSQFVLEVNAGTARKFNLKIGDRFKYSYLN